MWDGIAQKKCRLIKRQELFWLVLKPKKMVPVNAINSHNSPFTFEKGTFLSSFENAPTHVGAKQQSII